VVLTGSLPQRGTPSLTCLNRWRVALIPSPPRILRSSCPLLGETRAVKTDQEEGVNEMSRVFSLTLAALLLAATAAQAGDRRNEIQVPRASDEIQTPAGASGAAPPR
jgi:hypothetical protein